MPRQQPLGGVEAPRRAAPDKGANGWGGRPGRRLTAGLVALASLAAVGLAAGPAAAVSAGPCALPRTAAHHSEGLDTWNESYPRPERSLKAVMIFLSFPDWGPLYSPQELAADYFPVTTDYFRRASYGRFTLDPRPQTHWTEMPRDSSSYEIQRDWDAGQRTAYLRDAVAAADPTTDFSAYDIVYLVADPDAPGVDSDATKVVNFATPMRADGTDLRRLVTVFERHPPDRHVLAHETGHVFDLPDLYRRPGGDGDDNADWDTHVGDWDLMGSQFGLAPELFGWHKWKLGWLRQQQVACVVPGGGPISLQPLAASASEVASGVRGTRLAVVRTGPGSAIAIEGRTARGNDAGLCREGVLIYRIGNRTASGEGPVSVVDAHPGSSACWDSSVFPPLADAPLGEGERFTVAGEDGAADLVVRVGERSDSGAWSVRVGKGA